MFNTVWGFFFSSFPITLHKKSLQLFIKGLQIHMTKHVVEFVIKVENIVDAAFSIILFSNTRKIHKPC